MSQFPVHNEIQKMDIKHVDLLFQINFTEEDFKKCTTPLHDVVMIPNKIDLIELLLKYGADVNIKNEEGQTALHLAIESKNCAPVIELLLKFGAHVNAKDNKGTTPLHEASLAENNIEVLKCLIKHGANINSQNNFGKTPLHLAVNSRNESNVEFLKNLGARIFCAA